ncbi:unnamed protein product, partial [Symbiodinium necroappetens]
DPHGGLYVPSGNDDDLCSHMVNELSSKAAPAQPSSSMQMEGGDRRFTDGQHKGQTYEEVSRKVEFVKWALLQPSIPEGTYNPRPRGKGSKKVPPNPPKDRPAATVAMSQERGEHAYTVDPVPQSFHRERKAVSEKLVEATEQDRVSQAIALEERIHPAALHEWLREAITAVLTGARPAPSGDLSRPPWLPEAARHEAILLESFRADGKLHDPFPGDSSDDGAPGSYNVEELDDALERQAAEDAQKELDEAFERARQQIAADDPLLSSTLPRPLRISLVFVMWPAENSSAWSIRPAIQSTTIDTDRQSKTAMGQTVLKLTPGSVDLSATTSSSSAAPETSVHNNDLRELNDPHDGRSVHALGGTQESWMGSWLETRSGRTLLSLCFADIEKAVDGYKLTIILPFCTSNRYRSVAIGTLISAGLYVLGMDHFLGHLHANENCSTMKCGGKRAKCR